MSSPFHPVTELIFPVLLEGHCCFPKTKGILVSGFWKIQNT